MKKEPFILDKELYDFSLPENLIGTNPKDKRDESRLFVYDTKAGSIAFDTFKNISKYLPAESLLVLNETKVIPARVFAQKPTGGKIEILFLVNLWKEGDQKISGMVDRKIEVGDIISLGEVTFLVEEQRENIFIFRMNFGPEIFRDILFCYGETPVPHYIKGVNMTEENLRKRYQTVFAKEAYSIAAPTASLHFTNEVFETLRDKGIEVSRVSLHVGLGTFKPITQENIDSGTLHNELYFVDEDTWDSIKKAHEKGRKIVAVGTTSVRTLESVAKTSVTQGSTNIFIQPPFDFKLVDHLITNFHLPNSSLMMLVEAFLQSKNADKHLVELYKIAIKEGFQFYSFGDSMLIL